MEVHISYNEVLRFIRNHANVDVSRLQMVRQNSRTLAISYDISAWVPTVTISVSVDKVTEHHLYLSYDCSAAASMIISGVVSFLQSNTRRCQGGYYFKKGVCLFRCNQWT